MKKISEIEYIRPTVAEVNAKRIAKSSAFWKFTVAFQVTKFSGLGNWSSQKDCVVKGLVKRC